MNTRHHVRWWEREKAAARVIALPGALRIACALAAGAAAAFPLQPSFAQSFPAKPIRMIYGFAAGSGGEIPIRIAAAKAGDSLGQPIVLESQGGAGGAIASENVARAKPDGYMLLIANPSPLVVRQFTVAAKLPYDPIKDFTPVTMLVETVMCFTVNASLPVNSVKELIEYAKRNPGLAYGTNGIGGTFHLSGEQVQLLTGVKLTHVPYKGSALSMNDLVGGQISMVFAALASVLPHVSSGKAKLLAIMASERFRGTPGIPTLSEALPGFRNVPAWLAVLGPARLPAPVLGRLHEAFAKAIIAPDAQEKLEAAGFAALGNTPEQFLASLKQDIETVGAVVKAAGLKPE